MESKEPNIRNWFGGLVDGMRDASGQMYMRNRYYDPATGQFTQPDPIGLAGGLNAYGFAAGDPVSYSDPYGLYITCVTKAACTLWNRLYAQAYAASLSSNETVRAGGGKLLATMIAMAESDEQVAITVRNRSAMRRALDWVAPNAFPLNVSGSCVRVDDYCPEANGYAIVIDPGWSKGKRVSAETRLAHEIGHMDARMSGNESNSDAHSVDTENHYRAMRGCSPRWSHDTSGPACQK